MIICVYLNPTIDKTIYFNRFKLGATNRPDKVLIDGAGKAINVAVVLKMLNQNPIVIGLLCKEDGNVIKERLKDNNIDYDFLEIEGRCRLNTKIFDNFTKEITEINEKGIEVDNKIIDKIKEKVFQSANKDDIAVLTGSLPPGCADDTYAEIIHKLNKKGVKCVLDADGAAMSEGLKETPYLIKPNIDELQSITGEKIESLQQVYDSVIKIVNNGVNSVGVSMGKDGALLITKDSVFFAEPLQLDVKSTVGAGDSMVAGIVANINKDPLEALRSGCAAASASITLEGTKLATKELYDQMMKSINIKELKLNET